MNKLIKARKGFLSGMIDKWDYINKMYKIHSTLYDYAEYIVNTNISSIEIIDKRVVMTFRDTGIRFLCTENDKRLAPIDTLNFGYYEQDEMNMQLKLIEDGYNVLDIGANYGWYAMYIANGKPNTKVFSFEPIPNTFIFLNENIRLNKFNNIITFNFGLSDTDGSFNFYIDPHLSVNASLANVSGNNKIENITCSVKKLDNFVKDQNIKVDFIKCDVEGAELLVFKGGIEVIKKDCPIIFTEMLRKWTSKFNYHPNDIISFFYDLGYSCFTLSQGQLLHYDFVYENTIQTNYFFLHKEKHVYQISHFLKDRIH
jgi:FkbM family methyltransferase